MCGRNSESVGGRNSESVSVKSGLCLSIGINLGITVISISNTNNLGHSQKSDTVLPPIISLREEDCISKRMTIKARVTHNQDGVCIFY